MAEIENKIIDDFNRTDQVSSVLKMDQHETMTDKDAKGSSFFREYMGMERMMTDPDTGKLTPMTGEGQSKLLQSVGEIDVWNTKSKEQKLTMMSDLFESEKAGILQGELTTYTPGGKMLSVGRGTGEINPDFPDAPIMPKYWTDLGDGIKETTSQAWESAIASHGSRLSSLESLSAEDRADPDKVRDIWYPKASVEVGEAQVVEAYKPQYTGEAPTTKPYTGQR